MTDDDPSPTSTEVEPAATTAGVLDQLEALAEIEHALVVDYLLACCALGHDLGPTEGGATSAEGREAASAYSGLALNEMFHFSGVNKLLVAAGREPVTSRAGDVVSATGVSTPLCPPVLQDAVHLLDRHAAVVRAVDDRYAALRRSLASPGDLDSTLVDRVKAFLGDDGNPHTEDLTRVLDIVSSPPPADLVRVTHREAADSFEQRLLDAGDRMYASVLEALRAHLGQTDPLAGGDYRQIAVSCMNALDQLNAALVQRRLLPAFTAPP